MSQAIEHRMRIEPGTWVSTQGRRVCIVQVLDLETVVVQDAEKGEAWHAKIDDLWPEDSILEPPTETVFSELSEIEEKDWEKARERLELFSLCWMIWTVPVRRWRHRPSLRDDS